MLSRSLFLRRVSRYLHHTASSTTTLPSRFSDQNNKPCSATMRHEMNFAMMARAIFLSHCGVRVMRVAQQVHNTVTEDTTHKWELKTKGKLRSTSAHCATARRTAHEVRGSHDTDKQVSTGTCHVTENRQILYSAWFSKHTTHLRIHTSACLKLSNFLNTDRMRKPDCPTAVHMKPFSTSVFNNSHSFRATQILRQGPVHSTLWKTSIF